MMMMTDKSMLICHLHPFWFLFFRWHIMLMMTKKNNKKKILIWFNRWWTLLLFYEYSMFVFVNGDFLFCLCTRKWKSFIGCGTQKRKSQTNTSHHYITVIIIILFSYDDDDLEFIQYKILCGVYIMIVGWWW